MENRIKVNYKLNVIAIIASGRTRTEKGDQHFDALQLKI